MGFVHVAVVANIGDQRCSPKKGSRAKCKKAKLKGMKSLQVSGNLVDYPDRATPPYQNPTSKFFSKPWPSAVTSSCTCSASHKRKNTNTEHLFWAFGRKWRHMTLPWSRGSNSVTLTRDDKVLETTHKETHFPQIQKCVSVESTRVPSRSRSCEIVGLACLNLMGRENFIFILQCNSCASVLFSVHSSSCTNEKPRALAMFTTLDAWNVHFVARFTMFCVFADKSPNQRPQKKKLINLVLLNFIIVWGTIAATSPKREDIAA